MFDVFIHTFAFLLIDTRLILFIRHYMTFITANVYFEEACFTVIFDVWIHMFKFMLSYLTCFFKLGARENIYCNWPTQYKYVQ